jgi:hypothetical protein
VNRALIRACGVHDLVTPEAGESVREEAGPHRRTRIDSERRLVSVTAGPTPCITEHRRGDLNSDRSANSWGWSSPPWSSPPWSSPQTIAVSISCLCRFWTPHDRHIGSGDIRPKPSRGDGAVRGRKSDSRTHAAARDAAPWRCAGKRPLFRRRRGGGDPAGSRPRRVDAHLGYVGPDAPDASTRAHRRDQHDPAPGPAIGHMPGRAENGRRSADRDRCHRLRQNPSKGDRSTETDCAARASPVGLPQSPPRSLDRCARRPASR